MFLIGSGQPSANGTELMVVFWLTSTADWHEYAVSGTGGYLCEALIPETTYSVTNLDKFPRCCQPFNDRLSKSPNMAWRIVVCYRSASDS